MRLSDLVTMTPKTGGVDRICQVNRSHTMRRYLAFTIKTPHTMNEEEGQIITGVLPSHTLQLDICVNCAIEFMGDMHKQIQDLGSG